MHIEIHPKVEGLAAERLLDLATILAADKCPDLSCMPAMMEKEDG